MAATAVSLPLGLLDELTVALRVGSVRHQVAGTLPAEDRVGGDAPGRALEVHLALQEVEVERRVVEPPALPPAVGEHLLEDLTRPFHPEEVLLVGRLLVPTARRDLDPVALQVD